MIGLGGRVVPVINLRLRFGIEIIGYTDQSVYNPGQLDRIARVYTYCYAHLFIAAEAAKRMQHFLDLKGEIDERYR